MCERGLGSVSKERKQGGSERGDGVKVRIKDGEVGRGQDVETRPRQKYTPQ